MNFNWGEALQGVQAMGAGFINRLPYIILAVIVFFILALVGRGFGRTIRRITERRKRHQNLGLVLSRLVQGVSLFIALLIALVIAIPSFRPGQLVQLLGISSVAIGFAFRDILQNFLAGILLLLTEPFRIGDQIKTGEFEGTVEDIQTRATFIRTYDGRRIVVPNGDLFTDAVVVNTAFDKRRQEYDVGIGFGDDVEEAKGLMLEAMRSVPDVLADPGPDVLLYDFAPSSVTLRARWWVQPPQRSDALESRDKVLTAIKRAFAKNGIDLPFPTQHILFHDQTEESDGDRKAQREGWPAGKGTPPRSRTIASALLELGNALTAQPKPSGNDKLNAEGSQKKTGESGAEPRI